MYGVRIYVSGVLLLLLAESVAAQDSEFAFDIFSDIAPILALFGEQFARQFVSNSFTWLDHLISACVPLGIITIITGAIRIQGPQLARSFIGRAREPLAVAEAELMSSTSHEVCEMFNGKGIIRTMGRPNIAQILIFPDQYDDFIKGLDTPDRSCGIHILQTACEQRVMSHDEYQSKGYKWAADCLKRIKLRESDEENGLEVSDAEKVPKVSLEGEKYKSFGFLESPNLQLNTSSGRASQGSRRLELLAAVTIGLILQLSLLAISVVTVYHEPTRLIFRYELQPHALPCYIGGSVSLSIGMIMCSYAIEKSTVELIWERRLEKDTHSAPNSETDRSRGERGRLEDKDPQLIWVQKSQLVNDQAFDSYVILGGPKHHVLTSSRQEDEQKCREKTGPTPTLQEAEEARQANQWVQEALTLVGAFLGSLGFVAQFMGLRGLPWPCPVSHLLALFTMALTRALIRRHIGQIPFFCQAPSDYELDFLAAHIVTHVDYREFDGAKEDQKKTKNSGAEKKHSWNDNDPGATCLWKVVTPSPNRPSKPSKPSRLEPPINKTAPPELSTSQQLVRVRERLSNLCEWPNNASKAALALAHSIEQFMATFCSDIEAPIDWLIETKRPALKFPALKCPAQNCPQDSTDHAVISLSRCSEEKGKKWVVELGKIDAVLSLWLASFEAKDEDQDEDKDKNAPQVNINAREAEEDRAQKELTGWRRSSAGFGTKTEFCRVIGDDDKAGMLKRDISWWVDDQIVTPDTSGTLPRGNETQKVFIGFDSPSEGAENTTPRRLSIVSSADLPTILAQHLFTSFMWRVTQAMDWDCLRNNDVAVHAETFNLHEFSRTWHRPKLRVTRLDTFIKYAEMIGLGSMNDILLCMVPALSFQDLLPNEEIRSLIPRDPEKIQHHGWAETAGFYHDLLQSNLMMDDKDHPTLMIVVQAMEFIYLTSEPFTEHVKPQQELEQKLREIITQLAKRFMTIINDLSPVYEWQKRREAFRNLFHLYAEHETPMDSFPTRDIVSSTEEEGMFLRKIGFTKVHIEVCEASANDDWIEVSKLEDIEKADIFGWTALHYATITSARTLDGITPLLDNAPGPIKQLENNFRRNPFHLAVLDGTDGANSLRQLLQRTDKLGKDMVVARGLDGRTPVHLAVQAQNSKCFEILLEYLKPDEVDIWGRNLLHLAAMAPDSAVGIEILQKLKEHNVSPDNADKNGKTPLMLACQTGHLAVVSFLLETASEIDVNQVDKNGMTALILACQAGQLAVVSFLLETETVPEIDVNQEGNGGRTALSWAAASGHDAVVKRLLAEKDVQVDVKTSGGETPLLVAAMNRHRAVVEQLVKKGANINAQYRNGESLVYMASSCGDYDHLAFLIRMGVNVSMQTIYGWSGLHWAAGNGHKECVRRLLAAGADVNPLSDTGKTPLDMVGEGEIRQMLIEKGAKTGQEIQNARS